MKIIKLIPLFLIPLLLNSCEPRMRWEVRGQIPWQGGTHPAHWYTDTLTDWGGYQMNKHRSVGYTNSDGTRVVIRPPYTIIDHWQDTSKRIKN